MLTLTTNTSDRPVQILEGELRTHRSATTAILNVNTTTTTTIADEVHKQTRTSTAPMNYRMRRLHVRRDRGSGASCSRAWDPGRVFENGTGLEGWECLQLAVLAQHAAVRELGRVLKR